MFDVGLVVLKGSQSVIERKIFFLFKCVIPQVCKKLYVKLDVQKESDLFELIPKVYQNASKIDTSVDLRVLLNRSRQIAIDCVFEENEENCYLPKKKKFWFENNFKLPTNSYNSVVLGGTFDQLHNGHKAFLSLALLKTKNILTCGITDEKVLWELISPVEKRCECVTEFVLDITDGIKCCAVPITDCFGPSITDAEMECIVVSEETLKGGNFVNEKRVSQGLSKLDVYVVKLIADNDLILNEKKVSSSTKRRLLLGTILREPTPKLNLFDNDCYVIGLTGGIASGKTYIAKYLSKKNCMVIDCDKLAHQLYAESNELRNKLVDTFGSIILTKDNLIDRKTLGSIVFGNKTELMKLNYIVWPLIANKVKEIINNTKKKIVIVDAAVLLEAEWDKFVHQVWTTFVPPEEAIKRICDRDKLTIEQAKKRICSQISNTERIEKSNVVFCSLWDYSETENQVQKALDIVYKNYLK